MPNKSADQLITEFTPAVAGIVTVWNIIKPLAVSSGKLTQERADEISKLFTDLPVVIDDVLNVLK
jgi:hypothetical protein